MSLYDNSPVRCRWFLLKKDMKITRQNYELYFIDYIDGNLQLELVDEFNSFIEANPDLAEELDNLRDMTVAADDCAFDSIDSLLKKDIPAGVSPFEYQCISYIEGDMNEVERNSFVAAVNADIQKKNELNAFKKTKIEADETIVYKEKNSLKRFSIPFKSYLYAAASVAVLALLWVLWPKQGSDEPVLSSQYAHQFEILNLEQPQIKLDISVSKFKSYDNEKLVEREKMTEIPSVAVNETEVVNVDVEESSDSENLTDKVAALPDEMDMLKMLPIRELSTIALPQLSFQLEPIDGKVPDIQNRDEYIYRKSYHQILPQALAEFIEEKEPILTTESTKMGLLKLIRTISGDRIKYKDDEHGKITTIEYSSRMLAFSIPVK